MCSKALGILVLFAAGVAWPSAAFSQMRRLHAASIVEEVARCQECHTPRTETGELDKTKWMKGATIIGVPPTPVADWHQRSPDISSTSALWTRWGQDGLTTFLQTAKNLERRQSGSADAGVHDEEGRCGNDRRVFENRCRDHSGKGRVVQHSCLTRLPSADATHVFRRFACPQKPIHLFRTTGEPSRAWPSSLMAWPHLHEGVGTASSPGCAAIPSPS